MGMKIGCDVQENLTNGLWGLLLGLLLGAGTWVVTQTARGKGGWRDKKDDEKKK